MVEQDSAVIVSSPGAVHPDMPEVEVVERKGRGHPDSICDAFAEAFSISLTRAYHERCGAVLHHNVDKVLLAAGSSARHSAVATSSAESSKPCNQRDGVGAIDCSESASF